MGFSDYLAAALELALPKTCAGCGAGGVILCATCRQEWSTVPNQVSTRIDPGIPVWSLGVLGGVRRRTIINLKERGRVDVIPYLGAVMRASVEYLQARGEVDTDITLVPAPTKKSSAAVRGGDVVTRVCYASGLTTIPVAHLSETGKDAVGLSAAERWRNRLGAVQIDEIKVKKLTGHVLVVDDVITTGATLKATIMVLTSRGVKIRGGLGWSNA